MMSFGDRVHLRKKRIAFVIAICFAMLYLGLKGFPFSRYPVVLFDELHGMLYMVSMTENSLPENLDANAPVSASVWVPHEAFDRELWKERTDQVDEDKPLIVFSKTYCPFSRKAKELLARYELVPAPHIVEVDLRDDGDTVKALLYRFTGHATFPNIILRGSSLGGYDDLQVLHDSGALENMLKEAGVEITGNINAG